MNLFSSWLAHVIPVRRRGAIVATERVSMIRVEHL